MKAKTIKKSKSNPISFPDLWFLGIAILASITFTLWQYLYYFPSVKQSVRTIVQEKISPTEKPKEVLVVTPPVRYVMAPKMYVGQSFNNCGPATLSMLLAMQGKQVGQEELAQQMRPFNNPAGGVDDKSIFVDEFVRYGTQYGFASLHRPNGTVEDLKRLVANDIPVVVRTWLNPVEDIGHFRMVRGYDSDSQQIIVDDTYNGPNISIPNDEFVSMWRPFNYGYILVYPEDKQEVVKQILGEDWDEKNSWKNAIYQAEKWQSQNPTDSYDLFNMSVAYYHLGEYQKSVASYEKAALLLPSRMLWYQLEPIQAYLKLGQYDKVFTLTDAILYNGNIAYSELYQMRGEAYIAQGNKEAARAEFEQAVYYNSNFAPARTSLQNI